MVDPVVITILAYGHILSAMGWLGGALLTTFVISPRLQSVTPQSRLEFLAKVLPGMVRFVGGMILGTFVFGLLLLYALVGGDTNALITSTPFGLTITTGVALAVVAAIVGFAVAIPSFGKMATIAQDMLKSNQASPPQEMAMHSRRARVGSTVVVVLLLLVLLMMVVAGFY